MPAHPSIAALAPRLRPHIIHNENTNIFTQNTLNYNQTVEFPRVQLVYILIRELSIRPPVSLYYNIISL